jgi:tetratricopeptide (TPR) repeat protein
LAPLSSLTADPDALPEPLTPARLADVLDQAGQAAQALGKLDEARTLWQAVLTVAGDHAAATNHYLDLLLAGGSERRCRRSAGDAKWPSQPGRCCWGCSGRSTGLSPRCRPCRRSDRGQLAGPRVSQAGARAVAAAWRRQRRSLRDEWSTLLAQVYENAEQLGELSDARGYAERLAQLAETVKGQSVWLSRAAQCALRCGDGTGAKALLLQALLGTPAQLSLIGDYLEQATDEEAHEKLPGLLQAAMATATSATTPRGPEWQAQLQGLWVRAATIHGRMGDGPLAAQAYERALTVLADQTGSEALGLRRAVLEVLPDTEHDRARGHLHALLVASPRDVVLLGKLQAVEERAQNKGAASRLSQLLHLLDPSQPVPPAPTLPPKDAKLDETDHARLADPEARAMADILAALFDGVYSLKAPTLDSLGVQGTDRLQGSETSPDELARAFALSSRVLGNQRAGLYRPAGHTLLLPRIMAKLPTAVIASPQLGKRPIGELLFLVARAVEGLRPEFIMPMAMPCRRPDAADRAGGASVQSKADAEASRRRGDVEARACLPSQQATPRADEGSSRAGRHRAVLSGGHSSRSSASGPAGFRRSAGGAQCAADGRCAAALKILARRKQGCICGSVRVMCRHKRKQKPISPTCARSLSPRRTPPCSTGCTPKRPNAKSPHDPHDLLPCCVRLCMLAARLFTCE